MVFFKTNKGSLTVEAAIVIPIFICVIVSLAFFIKVIYVYEVINHALTETANELATYSYIYSATGIQKLHDSLSEELEQEKGKFNEKIEILTQTYECFKELPTEIINQVKSGVEKLKAGDLQGGYEDFQATVASGKEMVEQLEQSKEVIEDILKNPKQGLRYVGLGFAKELSEDLKVGAVLKPLARIFIMKHLQSYKDEDVNKKLLDLNVVGGLDGIDFGESRLFEDRKHIDLVVKYKMKLNLPFNFIPEMNFVQRVKVRAWLNGDGGYGFAKNSIWDMQNVLARGRRIQEIYGRNLPEDFKTLTKFENGIATIITSIDIRLLDFYESEEKRKKEIENKKRQVISRVEESVNDFLNFKGDKRKYIENGVAKEISITDKDIKERWIILVVPEGSVIPEFRESLKKCEEHAMLNGIRFRYEEL